MAMKTKSYSKFMTGAVTAAMVASAVAPVAAAGQDQDVAADASSSFTDISPNSSHFLNVQEARELGFLSGYDDGTFKPNKILNRGDVAKMLGKYVVATSGKTLSEYVRDNKIDDVKNFKDVPNNAPDKELVTYSKIVKHAGIFEGSDNNLMATKEMNRDQIAVVLVRAFDLKDKAGDTKVIDGAGSAYEKEIEILLENGVSDANPYRPFSKTSRAQFASFLVRAYKVSMGWAPDKPLPEEPGDGNGDGDGNEKPDPEQPGVDFEGDISIEASKANLLADGKDTAEITFSILGKDGKVDTNADDIVLELDTTHGTFASKRVAVQNGVAKATLTSEQSNKDVEVLVTAKVAEAGAGYKEMIGKKASYGNINFVAYNQNVETLNLTGAESNQTDRVTLHFDRPVKLEDFVITSPVTGDINYQYLMDDGSWSAPTPEVDPNVDPSEVRHALKPGAIEIENIRDGAGGSRYNDFGILGLKPIEGDPNSIEVILENDTILQDNSHVFVTTLFTSDSGKISNSRTEFIVTDARTPEVTKVTNEGLNKVQVKFSESIRPDTGSFRIDGTYHVNADTDAEIEYGEFDVFTLTDNRDLVTITLGENYFTTPTPPGYFTPGQHKIQVADARDFAGNKVTTQDFKFTVDANTTQPTAKVEVASPEQYHVTFETDVDGAEVGDFQFQVYDETTKTWKPVTYSQNLTGEEIVKNGPVTAGDEVQLIVSRLGKNKYAFELPADWTQIYNTNVTNDNYYNHKYRVVYAKDALKNLANGVTNAEAIEIGLNYAGSPLNELDTESPKITDVVQHSTSSKFTVKTDEPVKLAGEDNAGDTLSQEQESTNAGTLPQVKGKIVATATDGKKFEVDAEILGYTPKNNYDNSFDIQAAHVTLDKDVTSNRVPLIKAGTYTLQQLVDFGYFNTDFKLVVSQLTDDVGNTADTATFDFKMAATVVNPDLTPFYIVNAGYTDSRFPVEIAVTFSEGVSAGVTDVTKWNINGKDLPVGTEIRAVDNDQLPGNETVIISVKDPSVFMYEDNLSFVGDAFEWTNVITVDRDIVAADGSKLTGRNQVVVGTPPFLQNVAHTMALMQRVAALDSVSLGDEALVQSAWDSFVALTAEEQDFITKDLIGAVEDAADAIDALKAADQAVKGLFDDAGQILDSTDQAAITNAQNLTTAAREAGGNTAGLQAQLDKAKAQLKAREDATNAERIAAEAAAKTAIETAAPFLADVDFDFANATNEELVALKEALDNAGAIDLGSLEADIQASVGEGNPITAEAVAGFFEANSGDIPAALQPVADAFVNVVRP
ncbi:S-layer homology domain-containing protein [Bhargavaea cecembensis]|uniref:S-layer homology domain-containing protein n=1 Tax=Bhargavaea cecembensis TaxID=394098 RepID=UPI0005904020|nr:S-layer homology domain-containing protein [Bhargavaea cecembensis]